MCFKIYIPKDITSYNPMNYVHLDFFCGTSDISEILMKITKQIRSR